MYQTPIVPFTPDVVRVPLHFCEWFEGGLYVRCNGADCILCRVGIALAERYLLPVYLPVGNAVGVLPISPSMRPGSLLPAITPALESEKAIVLFVSKPDKQTF